MDSEELAASGFEWRCMGNPLPDISEIAAGHCWECREVIQIPRGFYADWDDMLGRIPEHDCEAKQHYSDPGPKPYGLGPCICADWFAQGETCHLGHCPQEHWTCVCEFASWGPTCRDCGRPRPGAVPEGW